MWKKALWIYLGLYILGVVILVIYDSIEDISSGQFDPVSLLLPLLMFLPAGVLVFELREKKVPILITILALLIVAVPLVGIFRFNAIGFATIGKALLFLPMLAGLICFGYKRLFGK
jgi:hypothetical protein